MSVHGIFAGIALGFLVLAGFANLHAASAARAELRAQEALLDQLRNEYLRWAATFALAWALVLALEVLA